MKITNIRAVRLNRPARPPVPAGRRPSWWTTDEVANPMSRYPKVKRTAACGRHGGRRSGAR